MTATEELEESMKYRSQMYARVIPMFLLLNIIAISFNVIVIRALRRTKMRNATSTLILSLTISDAWTSAIVAASLFYNSFLPIVFGANISPCYSLTLEILRTGGLISGTFQLLFISLHHYVLIVRPHCNQKSLQRVVAWLSLAAWIYPVLVLVALSLAFENEGFYNCQNVRFYHSAFFRKSVSIMLLFIFLCIIFFYARLLCILRTQAAKWKSKTTQTRATRENRTLWTAILICSSFFVGWAPATSVTSISLITIRTFSFHFTITCSTCVLLRNSNFRTLFLLSCGQLTFLVLKSFVNPLIYAIRIPEVDVQIRSMARGCLALVGRGKTNGKLEFSFNDQISSSPRVQDRQLISPNMPNSTVEATDKIRLSEGGSPLTPTAVDLECSP